MLYTNYYGCCRLFQTTIKTYKVPHLKSTNLNRIQMTTLTCCCIQVKQHHRTTLATATGNCDATNVTCSRNKYHVVTWTVYLESSMYQRRRRQWLRQIVGICHSACWNDPPFFGSILIGCLLAVRWRFRPSLAALVQGGYRWGAIAPPKTYESNFFH